MTTRYHSQPTGPVVSVIDPTTFADWVGVDVSDPLLVVVSVTATAAVIEYLQSELIARERVVTFDRWPTTGTPTPGSLSPSEVGLCFRFPLPYARAVSVDSVEVYGEVYTDFVVVDQYPAAIEVEDVPGQPSTYEPAAKITYTAGFGTVDDVPEQIRTAAMLVADYLYNHRGECAVDDAVVKSGAAMLLTHYRAQVVVL